MKKTISLLLLSSILTISAFAQDKVAKGVAVKILEIGKDDSYYEERADFVGKDAKAISELTKNANGYYSGSLETTSGRTVYFTSVKVSAKAAIVKSTVASGDVFKGSSIPKGTRFKVLEVPSDDAYHSDKDDIEGQTGTTKSELTLDDEGYTSGSIELDNGKSYYFYKVKLGKSTSTAPAKTVATTTAAKTPKFITGTIKEGTSVYVAEISEDDSYYSDRFEKVGQKGKVSKQDMTMKEGGWYAGDFTYDDGSTAYFYKAKFSKEPVDKLVKSGSDNVKSSGSFLDDVLSDDDEWADARNDDDIKEGDKVEVTAVSPEDSYYEDKGDYIGQQGIAGDDISYESEDGGYGGTVKLDNGESPYFYLVKLKKISSGTSKYSSSSSSTSSKSKIAKGTRVLVTDLSSDDSFYSDKSKYVRKKGKVADGLNLQSEGFYSGKILFDDGTDAYFYKVKVTILD